MTERARFTQSIPSFVVEDVVKTAEYYRDQLGFEIIGYFFEDPPVFAIVGRDGARLHIGKIDEGQAMRVNTEIRKGIGHDAYVSVDNIQTLYEEYKDKDVEIVEGPVERIYGCTELIIKDINGFQIVFGQ